MKFNQRFNIGDIWLSGMRGSINTAEYWTFQIIAEGLDDNGDRAVLGIKHMPNKRMFMVGHGACVWFNQDGRECQPLHEGFYLHTRSRARLIPLTLEDT